MIELAHSQIRESAEDAARAFGSTYGELFRPLRRGRPTPELRERRDAVAQVITLLHDVRGFQQKTIGRALGVKQTHLKLLLARGRELLEHAD